MDSLPTISELDSRFGIPGVAQVVAGNGGLAKVRITTSAASADVYLHGAQVTSWQPANAGEVLFISERSRWEDGRAIRGGIPICFPWFRAKADDPRAPAHGLVRTKGWKLDSVIAAEDDSVCVVCSTASDASTRQLWPYDFHLVHRVTVGRSLRLELITTNTGSKPFRFEEALHTYFRVGSVEDVCVRGLERVAYLDNNDGNREKAQAGELRLTGPTDNAYINAHGAAEVVDPVLRRKIGTDKENSATTIVWNPWLQGAAQLIDLGNEEWRQMVCVEASNILGHAVPLQPGEQHALNATLSIATE
jgi:glucose-6-phosphate 1-epimerase